VSHTSRPTPTPSSASATTGKRPKLPKIFYGGDYNPDQWPREVWDEDMRLFELAHIDVATVGVFAWSHLQLDEETFDFAWLDELLDKLAANGIFACLATATGAHPAWMARRHPDVLRVDFEGRKRRFGGRHNSCPNSPTYRTYSSLLASKLAERYRDHPALLIWHVSNEYGGACYCDLCADAFRGWLKDRYGSLDALNHAWNTRFWSHVFYDWDEIVPPSILSEHMGPAKTTFQGISLDYARFNSDSLLECYKLEYDALKAFTPDVPVTTNLMGTYKPLDYFKWAKHMDVVSWDNYPSNETPVSHIALRHDLMRGLKDGQPFLLMEQTPSQQNWQPYNGLKRPGVMRLWSYQAVARGADAVMFFQLRRSVGACEKYHGAVIEHVGHEHTRVFRECAELGEELKRVGDAFLGARSPARAAIVFDWENWWAIEFSSGPSEDLKYVGEVQKYYDAFYRQNIPVDVIGVDTELTAYDLVIAPVLYMIKPGYADRLQRFVNDGGTFVTTFFSGIVDESDLVTLGGYPGELRPLLGIWSEEIDALFPTMRNRIVMTERVGSLDGAYGCGLLCDLIHAEGADVLAEYGDDFYRGMPALTRHRYGTGQAWYVATSPEPTFLDGLVVHLAAEKGIEPLLRAPDGVEVTRRSQANQDYLFLLNHNAEEVRLDVGTEAVELLTGAAVSGVVTLPGRGVMILELP
jgi:beta-galactosidase